LSDAHGGVLAHQFEDLEQQNESAYVGMWAFILSEFMFFGGILGSYTVYRFLYPTAWIHGSQQLNEVLGGANTAVLILSSFTMAMAVRAGQMGDRKKICFWLIPTFVCGCFFLVVKYFEYTGKIAHGLFPNNNFHYDWLATDPQGAGMDLPQPDVANVRIYFGATGLHALHMIIGLALMGFVYAHAKEGRYSAKNHLGLECFGLYWHLVDLVWIFLFPLLYLLGKELDLS